MPNDICETLIDHWISELIKKPEKHDKVEFDIAVTAFTFDIDTRLDELVGQALSTDEKVIFKKYLRALTKNLIDGCGEGSIENALKKIQILKSHNYLRDIKNLTLEDLNTFVSEIIGVWNGTIRDISSARVYCFNYAGVAAKREFRHSY